MKSAKEESTGYTDTSFMKPSLIYFPIIRTISRIVSKFRSSSHSLATFHESDIPNFKVLHGDGMVRQPAFSGLEPCRVQFTQSVLKERAPACFLFRLYHRHDIRDFSQQQAYRPPSGCKTLPVSGFQQPEDVFRRTEARYPALLPAQTATALYRPSSCLADDPL